MTGEFVVGVDFGATNLRAGVCGRDGQLLSFVRRPTEKQEGTDAVIGRIAETVKQAITESSVGVSGVRGVAIGACGLVDSTSSRFVCSSVMPEWHDVPLAERVAALVGLPVTLENDANAAIFGEWFAGIARGLGHVVGMTLGTGIGGAAILDGRLYRGASGQSAEFGHVTVDPDGVPCFCGNRGCLGTLAGAEGIVQRYKAKRESSPEDADCRQHLNGLGRADAEKVFWLANQGDEAAKAVVAETARYLGIGSATLLSCFNPEMVVFTGGITRAGNRLLEAIREEARGRTYPPIFAASQIQFGQLADKAGVVGAAGVFFHALNSTGHSGR